MQGSVWVVFEKRLGEEDSQMPAARWLASAVISMGLTGRLLLPVVCIRPCSS